MPFDYDYTDDDIDLDEEEADPPAEWDPEELGLRDAEEYVEDYDGV